MKNKRAKIYIAFFLLIALATIAGALLGRHYLAQNRPDASTPTASDIQTFTTNEYGFSFKYSAAAFFVADETNADGNHDGWILVMPIALKNNPDAAIQGIVISPRANDPSETALDWLEDPNAGGYDISQGYKTEQVGGREALSVENGDWVVVNTPDNTERLSIAILPPSATSTSAAADLASLRSEMKLVTSSLSFGNH